MRSSQCHSDPAGSRQRRAPGPIVTHPAVISPAISRPPLSLLVPSNSAAAITVAENRELHSRSPAISSNEARKRAQFTRIHSFGKPTSHSFHSPRRLFPQSRCARVCTTGDRDGPARRPAASARATHCPTAAGWDRTGRLPSGNRTSGPRRMLTEPDEGLTSRPRRAKIGASAARARGRSAGGRDSSPRLPHPVYDLQLPGSQRLPL